MERTIEQWKNCDPKEMAKMSEVAIRFAFEDAKADILTLYNLLEMQNSNATD